MKKMIYITDTKDADINYIKDSNTITVFKGLNLLEVHHPANATKSAEFLKVLNHYDIFVLSQSSRALIEAQEIFQYTRLVYEPRRKIVDFNQLAKKMFSMRCFTVCLNIDYATQEIIRQLNYKGIKVIIRVNSQLDVYKAALAGADGVLGQNLQRVKIDSDITSLPFLISHRGYHEEEVENSLKAAKKAYDRGADILEMDVHLTKDNKIVVNHDPSLGRTYNKDYVIKYNDLSELKQAKQKLKGKTTNDTIATLHDFDKNLPEDFTFLVETKVESPKAIKTIAKMVNTFKRNVMVMSFYPLALINFDSYLKGIINGLLLSLDDDSMDLLPILKVVNKYKLIIHPYYQKRSPELEEELKRRIIAVSPWGIQKNQLEEALKNGYDMINSNYVHLLNHLPKRLITKTNLTFYLGSEKAIKLFDNNNQELNYEVHLLFNNPKGIIIENGTIVAAKEIGEAYLYLTYETKVFTETLKYASDLITINIKDKEDENGTN